MADFLVALWTLPRDQNWKRTWRVRAKNMRTALDHLERRRLAHTLSLKSDGAFQAIFLGPEYYYTERSQNVIRQPLSDSDRRSLEETLLAFSLEFPKILIIPGSAFYVKPLVRGNEPREQLKFNPATGQRDMPKTAAPGHRKQQLLGQVNTAIAAAAVGPTPDVNTKWGVNALNPVTGALEARWWDPADTGPFYGVMPPLLVVRDKVQNAAPRIARNATYALLAGKRLAKYDKQADFFESTGQPDDMVFIPGTKNQCPVIGGYRFGFEICFDHANATLKHRAVPDLAFHLVVSDHVINDTANMAMAKNGYFLHASTSHTQTCVYLRDQNGVLENLTADKRFRIERLGQAGEYLDFYKLPLPA